MRAKPHRERRRIGDDDARDRHAVGPPRRRGWRRRGRDAGAAPRAALCCGRGGPGHVRPEPARAAGGPGSRAGHTSRISLAWGGGSHVACARVEENMIIFCTLLFDPPRHVLRRFQYFPFFACSSMTSHFCFISILFGLD
jgi:hypothetical protein